MSGVDHETWLTLRPPKSLRTARCAYRLPQVQAV